MYVTQVKVYEESYVILCESIHVGTAEHLSGCFHTVTGRFDRYLPLTGGRTMEKE